MHVLRSYVRSLLTEITQLPKEWFSEIDRAVMASNFWDEPNEESDVDAGKSGFLQTPAAATLEYALREVFSELGIDVDVFISSHDSGNLDMMLHPEHPAYPNRWLMDARWYVSKQRPGRNTVDMEIMVFDETADPNDVDPAALVRHINQSVRHELVHYTQMKKQSIKKGLYDDIEAFDEMLQDPKQVPNEDNPKYWEKFEPTGLMDEEGNEVIEKEGFNQKLYTQDYLTSHIEIDAHAHDASEEILAVYGYDKALELMKTSGFDLTDPKLPNAIQHYYEYLQDDHPGTIQKLLKKMTKYIDYMRD